MTEFPDAACTAGLILMNDAADGKGDPSRRRSRLNLLFSIY
jgi:hypothetical protein